jgi:lipopolysaccharide biosynthesis glycosyltransferase
MAIKIFIGSSPNGEDREIERIYEYSLRKHCTEPLDIEWMKIDKDESNIWGGWNTSKWFTPFSGFRWAIPHFCNYEGKAIYTDVDMINFRDIKDLYYMDMNDKPFAAREGKRWGYEFCVMVIDCAKAKEHIWDIEKLKNNEQSHSFHRKKFAESNDLIQPIDKRWNCLDGEDLQLSEIYQLHFTNMSTQPWKPTWYEGETQKHQRDDIIEIYSKLREECELEGIKLKEIPDDPIDFNILL